MFHLWRVLHVPREWGPKSVRREIFGTLRLAGLSIPKGRQPAGDEVW
jgi:hypothetical protein